MEQGDKITLVLEGLPEDDGQVRLTVFMSQLQSLSGALSKLDRDLNSGKPASSFRIAELSYNSPVRVVIAATPRPNRPHVAGQVLENFGRIAEAIKSGAPLETIDADLLEDIQALARPVGKQLKTATILFDDHQLDLTEAVSRRIDEALAVAEECSGVIEGDLEQINVHDGANTFHIYPAVGPKKITCRFPNKLYEDAVAAVGKRVEVYGILRFRPGASYPHQIAVTDIEIFPPESELPDWDDLRGRAPNATGGLSSEAFVRELRDGWRNGRR